jgi:hypothetical protein
MPVVARLDGHGDPRWSNVEPQSPVNGLVSWLGVHENKLRLAYGVLHIHGVRLERTSARFGGTGFTE